MGNEMTAGPSPEELEIVDLLAQGYTDEVVVARLGLTTRTYRRRLRSVMDLLGARSRFQAGVHAARRGWVACSKELSGHLSTEEELVARRTDRDTADGSDDERSLT